MKVTLIGLVSGIAGTSIGGLSAFFINNIKKRSLSFILEFSAGLMTSVVCFELIPEAIGLGGASYTLFGVVIGVLSIVVIENHIIKIEYLKKKGSKSSLLRAGILMSVAIALHNLPEGFAVGSGFEASTALGITLTLAIVIHDIPEGIAMAVPMRAGGITKMKAFIYTVLSGVPMGIGAFLGALIGGLSNIFISICLGFAGGAMLYVVYGQLVPESKKMYLGRFSSIGSVFGILCGIVVSVYN